MTGSDMHLDTNPNRVPITDFKKSDIYRRRIHDLIPGGAHTYSKGDDQFPIMSPGAIARGKGAYIWDVDGNRFLDVAMGLASISLGHAYEPVLKRVREELEKGVNFQRPSYIELEMAEKFVSLIPGHDMIKFAKNGSSATTAAVKICRAATGRLKVAFPSDHPFYSYDDWFIGKSACPRGVPNHIQDLSLVYPSKDLNALSSLFAQYPGEIACVISEPERPDGIPDGFLDKIIDLCHKNGALFIQDEMITGFHTGFPGSITKYGSKPDLATWGKGIANGFSFCALTGKREYMELGGIRNEGSEKLFLLSTTHGGETHAIAAGLATIDVYESQNVVSHLHTIGRDVINQCSQLIEKSGLSAYINMQRADWMPVFVFKDLNGEVSHPLRGVFMQEMIKWGVLFQGGFTPCFSHTNADVSYFAEAFGRSLEVYKKALEIGWEKVLVGPAIKPVFRKRL